MSIAETVFAFDNNVDTMKSGSESKSFKRMFYYSLLDFALSSETRFCALLGPRKIGKTIALGQLQEELLGRGYKVLSIDFATIEHDYYIDDLLNHVLSSISNNSYDFILLDEITYVPKYDNFISNIGDTARRSFSSVKIVFTGSSEIMIHAACRRGIATQIVYVRATFLNFVEYLVYTGKRSNYDKFMFSMEDLATCALKYSEDVTVESFNEYIENAWKFSGFDSLKEYLSSCIEENIVSNTNRVYETRNPASNVRDTEFTICILCLCLYHLHNNSGWDAMRSGARSLKSIQNILNKTLNTISKEQQEIFNLVLEHNLISHYAQNIGKYNFTDVKAALKLLYDCRLVCFQSTNNPINSDELLDWFSGNEYLAGKRIVNVTSFFKLVNVLVVSPLPFVGLLKDLLMDLKDVGGISLALLDVLTGTLLGSFIETFLKGAYCDAQAQYCITELHKTEQGDAEVDLIDFKRQIMYEMSISDKSISATHFHVFQDYNYFTKVLIGKKITRIVFADDEQGIYRVPYPIFVFWLNSIYYTELCDLIN